MDNNELIRDTAGNPMEEGMTYYVKQQLNPYIFRYAKPSSVAGEYYRNVIACDIVGENRNFTSFDKDTDITVFNNRVKYELRRATVEEDIFLDECKKAGRWMSKDEAMERFEKRFII